MRFGPLFTRTRAWGCAVAVAAGALALSGCTASDAPQSAANVHDVGIDMSGQNWLSVGEACKTTLETDRIAWVRVSSPAASAQGGTLQAIASPASYSLTSSLGSPAQFTRMVTTCKQAGVNVYATLVANNMAAADGTATDGTAYQKYSYPGLYTDADFHHCTPEQQAMLTAASAPVPAPIGSPTPTPTGTQTPAPSATPSADDIRTSYWSCESDGRADLDTSNDEVRQKLRDYVKTLLSAGVSGLVIADADRIDPADINAFLDQVPSSTTVIAETGEVPAGIPVTDADYATRAKVLSRALSHRIVAAAKQGDTVGVSRLTGEKEAAADGILSVSSAGSTDLLSEKDGADYRLATLLMLASEHGTPMLTAGPNAGADAPLPVTADGTVADTRCSTDVEGWSCPERDRAIQGMLEWRSAVGSDRVLRRWDSGNQLALSRGQRGFLAVNDSDETLTRTFVTGLPAGSYCDEIANGAVGAESASVSPTTKPTATSCGSTPITVDANGNVRVEVPAHSAIAISVSSRTSN